VLGYGLKEASHAMRNIGFRGVAILDRHLLRLLVRCGVYDEIPSVSTRSAYWSVEEAFMRYAAQVGIDMDELDLLFWCAMTGHILK
jgi:N-glycosylase/DNA lyase